MGPLGCDEPAPEVVVPPLPKSEKLVVVTPHNETIRSLFESAFSDWHFKDHKSYVQIEWIPMGTPQCVAYVLEAARSDAAHAGRSMPDLMFGGGVADHAAISEQQLARPVDLGALEAQLPAAIGGIATRDPQNRWHSSALSGFGILVNRKACRERGIEEPAAWKDLADPRFFGWIALADPERSGSHRQCLTIMLQKYGWEEGWGLIIRTAANARALTGSSEDALAGVASGLCLAGFSVNFNALRSVEEHGADRLAYVNPEDASAITPDVLSVLAYGPNPEVAERFVRFCVSDDGQRTWAVKAEHRGGYNDSLYRYPINPRFYRELKDQLSVSDNPLEMTTILPLDQELEQQQARLMPALLAAACGDNHVLLQNCWRRLIDAGLPAEALAELTAPPITEAEARAAVGTLAAGGEQAQALIRAWSEQFKAKYEEVLSRLPAP